MKILKLIPLAFLGGVWSLCGIIKEKLTHAVALFSPRAGYFRYLFDFFIRNETSSTFTGVIPEMFEVTSPGTNGVLEMEVCGRIVYVVGGPYINRPKELLGFDLRDGEAFNRETFYRLPIKDFSVPTVEEMARACFYAENSLALFRVIYVGCTAGIGRTGLFMACLYLYNRVKETKGKFSVKTAPEDVINLVRRDYYARAIETKRQEEFIADFYHYIKAVCDE
jgi:protein-tyrosine phosphatase